MKDLNELNLSQFLSKIFSSMNVIDKIFYMIVQKRLLSKYFLYFCLKEMKDSFVTMKMLDIVNFENGHAPQILHCPYLFA